MAGLEGCRDDAPNASGRQVPLVWRVSVGPAVVPVGGGRAWPGFEATRRAKLVARTARGRAAAHGHTQRPGPVVPGTPVAPHSNTRNHAGPGRGARWRWRQLSQTNLARNLRRSFFKCV